MAQAKSETKTEKAASSSHPISDKVKETLHDSVETLGKKAASTEESIRETAHNSSESLAQQQAQMKAKWEESAIKQYATENPIATAGIAFAAGVLLTSLLKRR